MAPKVIVISNPPKEKKPSFWDIFYFPGWTIHPVLLLILLVSLPIGAALGLYFWLV
jgi:hypothetical protein